ncbi:MAG: hypothetical protein JXM70_18210 [Pirellulales bacterium]|nr:hypothetical protein [Pirellulales bacterium]
MHTRPLKFFIALVLCAMTGNTTAREGLSSDPLPSWNDGAAKQSIIDFVRTIATG